MVRGIFPADVLGRHEKYVCRYLREAFEKDGPHAWGIRAAADVHENCVFAAYGLADAARDSPLICLTADGVAEFWVHTY